MLRGDPEVTLVAQGARTLLSGQPFYYVPLRAPEDRQRQLRPSPGSQSEMQNSNPPSDLSNQNLHFNSVSW